MNNENRETRISESEKTPLRKISEQELKRILGQHQKWVESKGKEGERADLSRTNLQGADLSGASLEGANLQGADLSGASLQGADLTGVDLRGAHLQKKVNLSEATLREANLQDAKLRGAFDIEGARGLLAGQLAGANVSGAELPEDIHKFESLSVVEEASKNARKIFIAVLAGCVYSWLTIATTTDARLLTNSSSSPLPIIQTPIPIAGFYWVAPLVLLSMYFYFHIYLQRLWEGLAGLPAVFPDGRPLDKKAYPWLLSGLVRAHFRLLRDEPPALFRLQNAISIILAWWFVPVSLLLFWSRYLTKHDWWGTALHIIVLCVSAAFGTLSYRISKTTLRTERAGFRRNMGAGASLAALQIVFLFVFLFFASLASIEGLPFTDQGVRQETIAFAGWVPIVMADVRNADLSVRPPDWYPSGEHSRAEIATVKRALLQGVNLRYAQGDGVFLANADLEFSDLSGASLWGASLMGADLSIATLRGAEFHRANLQFADLGGVYGEGASFAGANLQDASFIMAKLNNAVFDRGVFRRTNFSFAKLQGASIRAANLSHASLWAADLFGANLSCIIVLRGEWISGEDCTVLSNSEFSFADLRGANLYGTSVDGANFERADLRGANLSNIKGWREILSLQLANVHGVVNPPKGFVAWATQKKGAVSLASDEEWQQLMRESPFSDAIKKYVPPGEMN